MTILNCVLDEQYNDLRIFVSLMVEKIRSKQFNFNEFRKLSWAQQYEYAKKTLKYAGSGSSRAVFILSSNYVLKIAHNNKGLAQNEAEVSVYTEPKTKTSLQKYKTLIQIING